MATILQLGNKAYEEKLNDAINECKSQLLTNKEWSDLINYNKGIKGFQVNKFGEVDYLATNGMFVRVANVNESPEGTQPTKVYATLSTDLNTAITSAASCLGTNIRYIDSTLSQLMETIYGKVVNFFYDEDTKKTYLSEDFIETLKNELIKNNYFENYKPENIQQNVYKKYALSDTTSIVVNSNIEGIYLKLFTLLSAKYGNMYQNGFTYIHCGTQNNGMSYHLIVISTDSDYLNWIASPDSIKYPKSTWWTDDIVKCAKEDSSKISVKRYNIIYAIDGEKYVYNNENFIVDSDYTISGNLNNTYNYGWVNIGTLTNYSKNKKDAILPSIDTHISSTYPNWYNNAVQGDTYTPDPDEPDKINTTINNYYPTTIINYPKDNEDDNKDEKGPDDYTQDESQTGESNEQDVQDGSDNATDNEIQQGVLVPTGKANYDLGKTASTTGHKLFNPVSTFFSIPYKFNMGSEGSKMLTISSWLWSDSGLKELLKFFANDPFQAIISCKAIPCPCTVASGEYPVVFGSLQVPNVTAKVITERMHVVNCGSLSIDEHFENCMDFSPYSSVSMYLPFIGIVSLEIDDIMGGIITVSYNVDTITGDAICNVTVSRNEMIAVLYQYPCNVAVDIPISGADYSAKWGGAVAGLGSLATGLVMKKPAMAVSGLVGGALALSKGGDIQRSGQLTGNTGALGFRRPYLIINRPVPDTTFNFEKFQGIGSHQNVYIKNLTGYNRCKEVHVDGISNATNSEKDLIENVLKGGFIL